MIHSVVNHVRTKGNDGRPFCVLVDGCWWSCVRVICRNKIFYLFWGENWTVNYFQFRWPWPKNAHAMLSHLEFVRWFRALCYATICKKKNPPVTGLIIAGLSYECINYSDITWNLNFKPFTQFYTIFVNIFAHFVQY